MPVNPYTITNKRSEEYKEGGTKENFRFYYNWEIIIKTRYMKSVPGNVHNRKPDSELYSFIFKSRSSDQATGTFL